MSTGRDELVKHVRELDTVLDVMREQYGDNLYSMRDPNGRYLAADALTALVNGYAALAWLDRS